MVPSWVCVMFFLWLDGDYGLWGVARWKHSAILIVYQEYPLSTWLITVAINVDHLTEVVLVRLLHCSYVPPFHAVLFEGSHPAQPTFKEWWVMPHLFEGSVSMKYLECFCMGDLSFPPNLFICLFKESFILVGTYGYLFILWTIIQNCFILFLKVFQLLPVGALSFIWLLCGFDIPLSLQGVGWDFVLSHLVLLLF